MTSSLWFFTAKLPLEVQYSHFRDISVLICFYLNAFELGKKIDCCLDVLLGFDTIKQKYSLNKMKTDINKKVRILLFLNFYKMQQLLTNFYDTSLLYIWLG